MLIFAGIVIGLVLGAALVALVLKLQNRSGFGEAARRRDELIAEASREADNLRREAEIEARERAMRFQGEADQAKAQLRVKYFPMFEKVIGAKRAARLCQLDRMLTLMVDLQIGSDVPLIAP